MEEISKQAAGQIVNLNNLQSGASTKSKKEIQKMLKKRESRSRERQTYQEFVESEPLNLNLERDYQEDNPVKYLDNSGKFDKLTHLKIRDQFLKDNASHNSFMDLSKNYHSNVESP